MYVFDAAIDARWRCRFCREHLLLQGAKATWQPQRNGSKDLPCLLKKNTLYIHIIYICDYLYVCIYIYMFIHIYTYIYLESLCTLIFIAFSVRPVWKMCCLFGWWSWFKKDGSGWGQPTKTLNTISLCTYAYTYSIAYKCINVCI